MDYAHSEGQAALGRDPREYLVQTKSFKASPKERWFGMGLLGPLVEIEIIETLSTPQKVLDWETRYEPYLADHRIEKPSTRLGDETVFTGWDETMLLACEWRKPFGQSSVQAAAGTFTDASFTKSLPAEFDLWKLYIIGWLTPNPDNSIFLSDFWVKNPVFFSSDFPSMKTNHSPFFGSFRSLF